MAIPIDFYFDFSSPYGYFASTRIEDIAARHGRAVTWRPILLGAAFKITGGQPLPTIPLKGSYAAHDLARCARLYKVPFKLPTRFPIGATAPARAFYWVGDRDAALASACPPRYRKTCLHGSTSAASRTVTPRGTPATGS